VPVQPPKAEAVAAAAPEPLPDFVVLPGTTTDPHAPPPAPEPEPEPELGPLPDYVVDPNRPDEPKPPAPKRTPAATSKPLEVASEPEPETSTPGLYFPPVAAFPAPRDDPDDDSERRRDAPKAPPRRPAPDPGKSKRGKSGAAEPGDEAEEISWMEGLSNRLSAYSLAEEDADASSAGEPTADKPEDGETGT
jgi:hypothetical protein